MAMDSNIFRDNRIRKKADADFGMEELQQELSSRKELMCNDTFLKELEKGD
jgi:hypothetical protein